MADAEAGQLTVNHLTLFLQHGPYLIENGRVGRPKTGIPDVKGERVGL